VIGALFDDLLLKGHGIWVKHPHIPTEYNPTTGQMEAAEMKRVFAPSEVPDGVNPIHVNPYTSDVEAGIFKLWGESPEHPSEQDSEGKPMKFLRRDVLTTLVDEYLRALVKAGKIDPRHRPEMELKKVDLRGMLNRAAKMLNSEKDMLDPNRYPEEGVWVNPDSRDGQHPAFLEHVYTPRFQHLAKEYVNGTWVVKPRRNKDGTSDMDTHPSKVLLRNGHGKYTTVAKSDAIHDDHGEMTEGLFFAALPQANHLFKQENPDVKLTSKLSMGNIIEPGAVVSAVHDDGSRSFVLERALTHSPSTSGRAGVSPRHAKHPPVGFEEALMSLHPVLFTPMGQPRAQQERFAKWLLTNAGQINVDLKAVNAFARSPVCQMLYNSMKGQSADRGGSMGERHTVFRKVRQAMAAGLGIPHTEYQGMPDADSRKFGVANHNIRHMSINNTKHLKNMTRARSSMKSLLYYSMLYAERPELEAGMASQLNVPSNFSTGKAVKDALQPKFQGYGRVGPESFEWDDESSVPRDEPYRKAAPKQDIAPYLNDTGPATAPTGGSGQSLGGPLAQLNPAQPSPPSESPYAGLFGINSGKKSADSLHDLMESLQSADARMDDLVLKELPEFRRFDLFDNQDCDILCDTFELQQRDLHFIQERVGDWTSIAKELNVDPYVVKAVKVALRW